MPPCVQKSVLQDTMICSCLVVGRFFFFLKVCCSSSDISKRLLNLFFTLQTKTKFTYLLYPQMLCEFHQKCISRVFFLLSFCILFFWWEVLKNMSCSTNLLFSSFLFFLPPPPSFLTFVNSFTYISGQNCYISFSLYQYHHYLGWFRLAIYTH